MFSCRWRIMLKMLFAMRETSLFSSPDVIFTFEERHAEKHSKRAVVRGEVEKIFSCVWENGEIAYGRRTRQRCERPLYSSRGGMPRMKVWVKVKVSRSPVSRSGGKETHMLRQKLPRQRNANPTKLLTVHDKCLPSPPTPQSLGMSLSQRFMLSKVRRC